MNSRKLVYGLMAVMLFLTSCKKTLFNFNFLDKESITVNNLDFDYLEMKSKIRFHDGKKLQKASAHMRLRKDSIIWISITPYGIEAARAMFTQDSLVFMDKINKTYFVQHYDELSDKLKVDVDFKLLQGLLVGNTPFPPEKKRRIVRNDENFEILQRASGLDITNVINPTSLKAEKIVVKQRSTGSTLSAEYGDFRFIDKKPKKKRVTYFPFDNSIDMIYYVKDKEVVSTRVLIECTKVQKADKLRFPFKITKKYDRIQK
ncbi:DUF4292 domain-containing protein [Fulvitalea axinellae]